VALLLTGTGRTLPPSEDGSVSTTELPKPVSELKVYIGGRLAEIVYAGAAPALAAGVTQVNARITSVQGPRLR
jgi:uncharacterized protein (TIGR03437 family)